MNEVAYVKEIHFHTIVGQSRHIASDCVIRAVALRCMADVNHSCLAYMTVLYMILSYSGKRNSVEWTISLIGHSNQTSINLYSRNKPESARFASHSTQGLVRIIDACFHPRLDQSLSLYAQASKYSSCLFNYWHSRVESTVLPTFFFVLLIFH